MKFMARVSALLLSVVINQALANEASSLHGFVTLGAIMHQEDKLRCAANAEKGSDWITPSAAGVQARYHFSPQWSATAQVVIAPDEQDRRRLGVSADWFFASYQASDNWQLRVGKLRLPLLMFSEKLHVGVGYPMACLPAEVYSLTPINSYKGADVLWRHDVGDVEVTVQPYVGYNDFYYRNTEDGIGAPQKYYQLSLDNLKGINVHIEALNERLKLRLSYLQAELNDRSGWTDSLVQMGFAGYALNKTPASLASLGFSWQDQGWMFLAEATRREIEQAGTANPTGCYGLIGKQLGAWMPYVSYALVDSERGEVKGLPKPIFQQATTVLGMNYRLNAQSLLKAEWRWVAIGKDNTSKEVSVDRDTGKALSDTQFNVLQFTYNYYF